MTSFTSIFFAWQHSRWWAEYLHFLFYSFWRRVCGVCPVWTLPRLVPDQPADTDSKALPSTLAMGSASLRPFEWRWWGNGEEEVSVSLKKKKQKRRVEKEELESRQNVGECQLFSTSFLQAFSELWTITSGVYPVGLKSATPKMPWKSHLTFGMRVHDSSWTWGKKSTFNICCQFYQFSLRPHLLRCHPVCFHCFGRGVSGADQTSF